MSGSEKGDIGLYPTEVEEDLQSISEHPANSIDPDIENEERRILLDVGPKDDVELSEVTLQPVAYDSISRDSQNKKHYCHFLSPRFQLYVSHFLSSWGDRMWSFAGGLFLIELTPRSLRLVAIYEASLSLTVILLGSAVGRWVDRTSRLTAARLSLVVQNVMVCLCTLLLCLHIFYKSAFENSLNGWAKVISQTSVVIFACIAQVGTLGSKIAIEKDWIVVISEQKEGTLSTMNSVLRSVDLSTKMMAPVLVGFVMSSSGMIAGGIVIASWNAVSLLIEYGLLHNLYMRVTALQRPKRANLVDASGETKQNPNELKGVGKKMKDAAMTWKIYFNHKVRNAGLGIAFLYMTVLNLDNFSRAYVFEGGVSKFVLGILTACASVFGILGSLTYPFLRRNLGVLRTGVFGFTFETICLVFCVVSVFVPGSLFVPSAIFGRDVQNETATRPFTSEIQNLSFSEEIQNSSFLLTEPIENSSLLNEDLHNLSLLNEEIQNSSLLNEEIQNSSLLNDNSTLTLMLSESTPLNSTGDVLTPFELTATENNDTQNSTTDISSSETDYTSVILLLTGIIISRLGLWQSDLTVTQILQEQVSENERGGINGVQFSLNQSFSMLRAIFVIILPTVETFGLLILLSFLFVAVANVLFCVYAYQTSRLSLQQTKAEDSLQQTKAEDSLQQTKAEDNYNNS